MTLTKPETTGARKAPAANPLLTGEILPTLIRLSVPNALAMVAAAAVAIAETVYVGQLGLSPLAGIALAFPMVMLQQMMSAGAMGGGVSSAISRALGAGDIERAERLALHATAIGLAAGLTFTAIFLAFGPQIFRALGGQGAALEQAILYANIAFLGAASLWLTNTFASILRGTGNMRVPSTALLIVAGVQVALSGGLGLGIGPLPRLGMVGIALGAVIAFTGGALFLAWYLTSGAARVRLRLTGPLQWEMFRDILKVGAIACVSPVQSVATVLIMTRMIAMFGTETLAGYGIGARLEFLLVPLGFAIGVSSVPMVGMAIGAGNVARARRVAWTASLLAACLIGSIGIAVAVAPDAWGRLFTQNEAVLKAARTYFAYAGPAFAFFGLGLVLYFASQGSGKILGPVLAQTVRLMVIAGGGFWMLNAGGTADDFFKLVGLALVAYGLAAALAVWLVTWEPARKAG